LAAHGQYRRFGSRDDIGKHELGHGGVVYQIFLALLKVLGDSYFRIGWLSAQGFGLLVVLWLRLLLGQPALRAWCKGSSGDGA
jgi:hypothetical protein